MSALLSCKMPSKYYGICAEKILKQSNSLDWLTGLPRIGELWKMYFKRWNEVLEVIEMGRNSRSLLAARGALTSIWFWLHKALAPLMPPRIQHLRVSNPERCSPWRRIRRDVWKTTTPSEYSSRKTTFPVEAPVLKTCTGTHLYRVLGYSCKHYAPLISLCYS